MVRWQVLILCKTLFHERGRETAKEAERKRNEKYKTPAPRPKSLCVCCKYVYKLSRFDSLTVSSLICWFVDKVRGGAEIDSGPRGDSGPVDVCVREGLSECVPGLAHSDMRTHRVYGMWVCAGACVQIQVKCVWKSVFVCLRVYVCTCTHTPICRHLYDFICSPEHVWADMLYTYHK